MKKRTLVLVPLAAGLMACGAQGAPENSGADDASVKTQSFKVYFAPRAATAPKLDGKLDDACWQDVEPISDYGPCTIFNSTKKRIPRTEVRLVWDEKYLYVAAKCWEDTPANMASFLKNVNDGKSAFFCRDCIEMHLDGNNDEHTTFQCWLFANDERYIHWNWDQGWGLLLDANYGLNADWDIAHSIGEDYWIVEARYALAHFELKPKVGCIFGLEPARFRYGKRIYSPEGEDLGVGGMFLAWGAQGKNHHNPDGYGKVILVDRKPDGVIEGLRLAFDDIDQRVIYVQTGSEYVVADRGKVVTLSYAEKARAVIAETDQALLRYRDFLRTVSNVVWKVSSQSVAWTDKSVREYETLRAKASENKEVDAAFVGSLAEKCAKWSKQFESAYWGLVRDAILVEKTTRVPATLDPGPNAPPLGSEFADGSLKPEERTHDIVKWAKPIAGPVKKVFITVNSTGGIDAWQLAKRMDMKATIFQSTGGDAAIGVSDDYFNEGHWRTPKKQQELERALKENGPFDAFVFIGTGISTWPSKLQCWLLERVLEGACVIEKNGSWRKVLNPQKSCGELILGSPKGMTKMASGWNIGAFDYRMEPVALDKELLKTMKFGKGVACAFSTDVTSGYCHGGKGSPAWPTKPDNEFQDEYGFAYLVRNVMQALGFRQGRRAVDVGGGLAEVEADKPADVGFRTAGAEAWRGEIGWRVRSLTGETLEERFETFDVPAGTNHVSLALKPLAVGEYYLDATLYAPRRKVIDFASARLVAKSNERFVKCGCSPNCRQLLDSPKIADVTLRAKTLFGKDDPVVATVKVDPVGRGLSVRAEIRDVRNRVIVREDFPIDAKGVAHVSLRNAPEYDWTLANLDVSLYDGSRRLDRRTEEFFRHRGNVDDYMVFLNNPDQGGRFGKMRLAYDMYNGIDLYQRGANVNFLSYGGDAVLRDRIPGDEPDCGGSLANPWWLKRLRERYGKHATALRAVNGRWISLGDDSGAPRSFGCQLPDWVPCWMMKQLESVRKVAAALQQRGMERKYAEMEATARWFRSHDVKQNATDLTWAFMFTGPVKKMAVKYLESEALTDVQLKEIVQCFKEVYGSIEKFNRAANANVAKWEDITKELAKTFKWDPSPAYVNFLFWLKERYGEDIKKLNAAWHADVKSFVEIPSSLIDEKLKEGVYTPSVDMQTYLEGTFVEQAKAIAEGAHRADPTVGLGFGASTLGNAFAGSIKWLDSVCPYAGSFDIEMMRGQKHKFIGECIGVYGGRTVPVEMRRNQVWHGLLTGCNFSWFWLSDYNYGDNSVDPRRYGAMFETYREVKRGPAALVLRSKRDNYGVRILVSPDSGHLSTVVKEMSTHSQALAVFGKLTEMLGLQYDSITSEQVVKGALKTDGVRVLLLPYAQAIGQKEAEAISTFVKLGGTVVADARVGVFDEKGVPYEKGVLDDVFGIARRQLKAKPVRDDLTVEGLCRACARIPSALVDASVVAGNAKAYGKGDGGVVALLVNDFGKGKAVLFNFNVAVFPFLESRGELGGMREALEKLIAMAGLRPMAVMKDEKGGMVAGTEFTRFVREDHAYLGVEKTGYAHEKFPMRAFVELDKKYWVYDVRTGKKVGFTDRIPMTLKGLDTGLYSLLPTEAKQLALDIPATVKPGSALRASATLDGVTSTRVFRWELIPEGGYSMEEFMPYPWRVRDAKDGKSTTEWAIGYDEKLGTKFTAVVTDVATGLSASRIVTVDGSSEVGDN